MVPKPIEPRLFTTMENMNINCESWEYPVGPAVLALNKESKLKLSVEARNHGDVIIVHCHGRIVYRDEAAALSRIVDELLHTGTKLILDLSGVSSSALAQARSCGRCSISRISIPFSTSTIASMKRWNRSANEPSPQINAV